MTGVLSECAHLRSLKMGIKIDAYTGDQRQVSEPHVETALLDMYAKCGNTESSLEVLYLFRDKRIYCLNAMISGMAFHDH